MTEASAPAQSRGGRSGLLRRTMALGLAALAAACSTVVPKSAPPPYAPPPVSKPSVAAPQPLPEDKQRHRIALLVPLTGRNATVGRSIADAATLAIVDTRDQALRVTTYDTGDTPASAVAAAQKALAEGNQLILGPLLAEDVRAVAAPAAAAGVPVIGFSNDLTARADNVWLLGFQQGQSIERIVRYAKSQGITRFAGLIPQGAYGRGASTMLIHAAEQAGGNVVAMQTYDRSARGLSTAVTALAKQSYDAVLIADGGRTAAVAAPMIRKAGGNGVRLLGTELWNAEPGIAIMPALAGGWYASVDNRLFEQLSSRFVARYGHRPFRIASLGYDAVLLTIRISASWKTGQPFPADKLRDADGFGGVDGAFRFGDGHVAERALAVQQANPGGATTVSPAPQGF